MRSEPMTRREILRLAAAGVSGVSLSGWMAPLARLAAAETAAGRRPKSCILLWMDGGPSHLDSFDPKPDAPANIRGEFASIATAVPGLRVCEKLPKVAGLLGHAAILRGMSTEEADHSRARIYLHTGYRPLQGGLSYPGLGSTVAAELGRPDSPLPSFVVTGTPLTKYDFLTDAGYRGPRHQPLVVADVERGMENLQPAVPGTEFENRSRVLEQLAAGFARTSRSPVAEAHRATLAGALRLMRSDRSRAFDLAQEPAGVRDRYGRGTFGQGCLLARRLVEAGVACVEVYLANWDSHERRIAQGIPGLLTQVDDGVSALVGDLRDRGLLDDTLIIWMGEFGRTPQVNREGGRDHFARAWSTVLIGGGVKGGQAVGATDRQGAAVVDRPISVHDFMATVCRLLGIDPARRIDTPAGRPIRIVEDKGEKVITEVIG